MADIEHLREQLRDTLEVIATTREWRAGPQGSETQSMNLRSMQKRRVALEERIARLSG